MFITTNKFWTAVPNNDVYKEMITIHVSTGKRAVSGPSCW